MKYEETQEFQTDILSSCKAFRSYLMWRDFYRYWFMQNESKPTYFYTDNPLDNINILDPVLVRWMMGTTGIPIIDAHMRMMNETGYMPPRGRAVVASFFVNDLKKDWRLGAMYFEDKLIDHDWYINWGAWKFSSGIDGKPSDRFNILL